MTLEYFSAFYFIYPAVCAAVFVAMYFGLRRRSKKTQYWVLFSVLALNFVLHFVKLCFSPYAEELPASIRKCTFENICAVSTLLFPFFMLSKRPLLMDYMFYLGTISGIASMFAPMNVIGLGVFDFETVRFYICHGSLWICPLLMTIFGVHKLNYHRIIKVIFLYFGCLFLILINEVILMVIGWVAPPPEWEGTLWEYFLSNVERNSGFIFGPPPSMENIAQFLLVFTPSFFKPGRYIDCYMPVLWEFFPVLIYGIPAALLLCVYWERRHMAADAACVAAKLRAAAKKSRIKRKKSRFCRQKFGKKGKRFYRGAYSRARMPARRKI